MAEHFDDSPAGAGPAAGRRRRAAGARLSGPRAAAAPPRGVRTVRLAEARNGVGGDAGTFLQRSGVNLFLKVLLAASVVILVLFATLLMELARAPGVPDADSLSRALARGDTLQALRMAAHHKVMGEISLAHRNAAWTHFTVGIKELVVTVFFPLLTGILGYIFGTREGAALAPGGKARG